VIIGLETAVKGGSISLVENGKEIDWIGGSEKFSRSEDLLKGLGEIFEKYQLCRKDIEKICVSKGPGSLTGIRIGMATALGIGNSLGREVFEITVLEAMRINHAISGKVIYAFWDGNSGVYFTEFSGMNEKTERGHNEIFHTSVGDFVQNKYNFVREQGVSIILTEDLARTMGENNHFGKGNLQPNSRQFKVTGNLARIIAFAGSTINASDNDRWLS
jgi:tRNA A37 threonylcarbamoyladenosine modification protein TsaB